MKIVSQSLSIYIVTAKWNEVFSIRIIEERPGKLDDIQHAVSTMVARGLINPRFIFFYYETTTVFAYRALSKFWTGR